MHEKSSIHGIVIETVGVSRLAHMVCHASHVGVSRFAQCCELYLKSMVLVTYPSSEDPLGSTVLPTELYYMVLP